MLKEDYDAYMAYHAHREAEYKQYMTTVIHFVGTYSQLKFEIDSVNGTEATSMSSDAHTARPDNTPDRQFIHLDIKSIDPLGKKRNTRRRRSLTTAGLVAKARLDPNIDIIEHDLSNMLEANHGVADGSKAFYKALAVKEVTKFMTKVRESMPTLRRERLLPCEHPEAMSLSSPELPWKVFTSWVKKRFKGVLTEPTVCEQKDAEVIFDGLTDLPDTSRRYLLRVNRRLVRLASLDKKQRYMSVARQVLRMSKSLNLYAAMRQVTKEGARGLGIDMRRATRRSIHEYLFKLSMPKYFRKAIQSRERKCIRLIQSALKRKDYHGPNFSIRTYIPKPGTSEERPLTFPSMIDRARETKILFVLLPQARMRMSVDESIGFWPNMDRVRGLSSFIARAIKAYGVGNYDILSADIAKYFGSIPEAGRRNIISALWIPTQHRDYLLDNMTCPFYDVKTRKFHLWPVGKASSEGSVVLPVIANMYLFNFDRHLQSVGIVFCRYADNLLFALPKRGLRGIPWHGELENFVEMNIQPYMPPGVTVYTTARPDKTREVKPGQLELGVYLNPHATTVDAVMQYAQGERHVDATRITELVKTRFITPNLNRFEEEWRKPYPTHEALPYGFRSSLHYNSGDQLILSVLLNTGYKDVRADPHDISHKLSENMPNSLAELGDTLDRLQNSTVLHTAVAQRLDRAYNRILAVYKRVLRESRLSPAKVVHRLDNLSAMSTTIDKLAYLRREGAIYPDLIKVWKEELYGIDQVALSNSRAR